MSEGRFAVTNDLNVAIEVSWGAGWQVLYPQGISYAPTATDSEHRLRIALRIREDPSIAADLHAQAGVPLLASSCVDDSGRTFVSWAEEVGLEEDVERERRGRRKLAALEGRRTWQDCLFVVFLIVSLPVSWGVFVMTGSLFLLWIFVILQVLATLLALLQVHRRTYFEDHCRALAEDISFEGNVLEGHGLPCVCSWPGQYASAWDDLVRSSQSGQTSAAVVFLPEGSRDYGNHVYHVDGHCWCIALYGKKKDWGCQWWARWMYNVKTAVQHGAELEVYFFKGYVGQGKVASFATAGAEHVRRDEIWSRMDSFRKTSIYNEALATGLRGLSRDQRYDGTSQFSREEKRLFLEWLPVEDREFLEASIGLGNSQKAEVASLEQEGYAYTPKDISEWCRPLHDGAARAPSSWFSDDASIELTSRQDHPP